MCENKLQPAAARRFALAAHGDQRYGAYPYATHLDAVANIASAYGDEATVIAYLHDVVEDTAVTVDAIEAAFGSRVARCVALVTDAPGVNRAMRKANTNARLCGVGEADQLALIVKTSDRLANLRACIADSRQQLLANYQREHVAFRHAVYRRGLCDELWRELDSIATSRG